MKLALLWILALPLTLALLIVLLVIIPKDEWTQLNDSLPPP